MEKIQSAIEKARAARNTIEPAPAAVSPGVSAGSAVVSPAGPSTEPSATEPSAAQARAAAWAALKPAGIDQTRLRRKRIVAFAGGADAVPFDMMRTKVLQQMRANGWKRLAITSPSPACGKSTIALNLAFSLARQAEMRTILAELDLRRPTLKTILGLRDTHSLSRVLEGGGDFADVALRYGEGLALAVNDGQVRQAAELLQSSSVPAVLAAIEARYTPDLMIFDMPPMLMSDDVMGFMGQVDAVLLVAAAETTTTKEIDACERELAAQTNVMGVVLNKCHFMGREYGYSYYG